VNRQDARNAKEEQNNESGILFFLGVPGVLAVRLEQEWSSGQDGKLGRGVADVHPVE
jgi:hypothetical protein